MALVQCNECGNAISDKSKICAHCGAPQKKKAKLLGIIIISLVVVLGGMCILGIVTATSMNKKIENISNQKTTDVSQLLILRNEYESLNFLTKLFVKNKSIIENITIDITVDNFREYFDIKISLSDYRTINGNSGISKTYINYIDQTITIQPKMTFVCKDVMVSINPNYLSYFDGNTENIRIDSTGNYSGTTELSTGELFIKVDQPELIDKMILITSATGKITI